MDPNETLIEAPAPEPTEAPTDADEYFFSEPEE